MPQLPPSFDPFILQDQLIKTLNNSQITQQFTNIRANQIIQSILLKPIVIQYKNQIKILKQQLKSQQNQQKTLRSHSKQTTNQYQKQLQKKQLQIEQLSELNDKIKSNLDISNKQIATLTQQLQQKTVLLQQLQQSLTQKQQQIHKTTLKLIQSQKLNQQSQEIIKSQEIQIQKLNSQIKQKLLQCQQKLKTQEQQQLKKQQQYKRINKQLTDIKQTNQKKYNNQIEVLEKQLQRVKEDRFQTKNQLNSYKIDYQELIQKKIQIQTVNLGLKAEIEKNKENFKNYKNNNDKQRKLINNRLYQLTNVYKKYQSGKKKMKIVLKNLKQIKNQYNIFIRNTSDEIRKLYINTQTMIKTILDELGQKVSKDLLILNNKLQQSTQQAKIAKAQTKLKEDTIQRLQRLLQNQNRQTIDLKNQTKIRKRQQQRLRRELRKNCQENQVKLNLMERKYLDLLNGYPY